jgi:hypothetical protein
MHLIQSSFSSRVSQKSLLCLALLLAIASQSFSQSGESSPAPSSNEDALQVVITSARGRARHLRSHGKMADRVGLRPAQRVAITLQLPESYAGQPVDIGPLDGGEIVGREGTSVRADGRFRCGFQAPSAPGLYRIFAQIGPEQYLLEFYVLDLVRPERNPPRVRIVD